MLKITSALPNLVTWYKAKIIYGSANSDSAVAKENYQEVRIRNGLKRFNYQNVLTFAVQEESLSNISHRHSVVAYHTLHYQTAICGDMSALIFCWLIYQKLKVSFTIAKLPKYNHDFVILGLKGVRSGEHLNPLNFDEEIIVVDLWNEQNEYYPITQLQSKMNKLLACNKGLFTSYKNYEDLTVQACFHIEDIMHCANFLEPDQLDRTIKNLPELFKPGLARNIPLSQSDLKLAEELEKRISRGSLSAKSKLNCCAYFYPATVIAATATIATTMLVMHYNKYL